MVVIEYVKYKLVDESKLIEFIEVQKKVVEVFAKKQKGFICWESCLDNEKNIRADILHWESLLDLENARKIFNDFEECKKMGEYISSTSVESLTFNSVHKWDKF